MTFHAITITTDATVADHHWTLTNEHHTLQHLQHACGGLIDVLALAPDLDMWIPDEGLYDGSQPNPLATAIAAAHGHTHQHYYGTAVFTGGPDPTGTTLALNPETANYLHALARRLHPTARAVDGAVLLTTGATAPTR